MAEIYKTENFILESNEKPEVDREDGGHIKISPLRDVKDRTELSSKEAVELMRFTVVCGKAFSMAMKRQGIELGRINYQDNGNWKSQLHIHLYGRAKNAKYQKYGDPINPGHKEEYSSLNQTDINLIAEEIKNIFMEERYGDGTWGL